MYYLSFCKIIVNIMAKSQEMLRHEHNIKLPYNSRAHLPNLKALGLVLLKIQLFKEFKDANRKQKLWKTCRLR